jgi:guanylate kinase
VVIPRTVYRPTILAGPSGVGKGTLVRRLLADHPEVWLSVSATTRPPRPGERQGEHYFFVAEAEFVRVVATDALVEWAGYDSARYGTPARPVQEATAAGRAVLLELELVGMRQARQRLTGSRTVLVVPPSRDELAHRLTQRGTEDDAARAHRLALATTELAAAPEFDRVLVNDTVERALTELVDFMGLRARQPAAHAVGKLDK